MKEIVLAFCGDWEASYLDGKLKVQGHQIRDYDWYKLGQENQDVSFADIKRAAISDKYAEEVGYFPDTFSGFPSNAILAVCSSRK